MHRVEREVIPPRRNYRLNYATVTLALIFASFVMGGTAFAVRWAIDEVNTPSRLVVQVGSASAPSATEQHPSNQALADTAKEHLSFEVVGVSPEKFFSRMLLSYQRGEVMREIVTPFFAQTNIFEGSTVSPPDVPVITGKSPWVKFATVLPTEVHVIIAKSLEPQFRDFLHRQPGVMPPSLIAESIQADSDDTAKAYVWVDIRFKSFKPEASAEDK